jgi:murein L,D-transpeptidase YafK
VTLLSDKKETDIELTMSKIRIFSLAVLITSWVTSVVAAPGSQTTNTAALSGDEAVNTGGFVKASINSAQRGFNAAKLLADRILVEKNKRRLTLFSDGEILKQYKISLGREPEGPKLRAGDNRTPEGLYFIDYRLRNSDYHLALHISYPNPGDQNRAEQMGYTPGGDIMLHGLKNDDPNIAYYHGYFDWTKGCIAVTDTEIEEIWRLVPNGTPIEIRP